MPITTSPSSGSDATLSNSPPRASFGYRPRADATSGSLARSTRRARIGTRYEGTNPAERKLDALVHAGAPRQALAGSAVCGDRDDQPRGGLSPPRPLQRADLLSELGPGPDPAISPASRPRALLRAGRHRAHRPLLLQAEPLDPRTVPARSWQHRSRHRRTALQLPSARQGPTRGRDRWRYRALDAAPGYQEIHGQHRRDRHRRRRRRIEWTPAGGISRPASG